VGFVDTVVASRAPGDPEARPVEHEAPPGVAGPTTGRSLAVPAAACLGVALVSLVLPATLAFDPWAWLVWGRETVHLDLDTTGGPSWKPLPVLVSALVSLTGDLAPTVWLVAARTAGLLAVVLAFRLAARFAGTAAGVIAAALLVLTPDGGPRFLRLVVEGHADTLSATLCLWAVERHLDGKRSHALLLGTGLALMRPEAWPFLGLYAVLLWRREPAQRWLVVVALAAVPLLWFGGDWWGSGSPWHGADAAQVEDGSAADRFGLAFERVVKVVVPPAWFGAAAGVGLAVAAARRRGGDRALAVLPILGGAAVAWFALVVGMSVAFGYAALSRFLLPGAALLCVLAGIALMRAVAFVRPGAWRAVVVAAAVAACVPGVLPRVLALETLADGIETRDRLERNLDAALDEAGGPDAVLACGWVAIDPSDVPRMALAWKLDVPLGDVRWRVLDGPGVMFAQRGGRRDRALASADRADVVRLARSAEWNVYAVRCGRPAEAGMASPE
jgi:hypothetical protein